MNKDSRKGASERPVVIVRKKAGKGGSPAAPAHPAPRIVSPATKVAAPATPPQPHVQSMPLPLAHPQPPDSPPSPAAPAITETGPSKTAQEKQARWALLEILRDRWPQAFPLDYQRVRPLAVGIRQDIAVHLSQQPLGRIGAAIGLFQRLMGPAYYRAVLRGGPRYDLDGNPRGEVTPEEQERAKRDLTAFFERRKERQKRLAAEKAGDSPET